MYSLVQSYNQMGSISRTYVAGLELAEDREDAFRNWADGQMNSTKAEHNFRSLWFRAIIGMETTVYQSVADELVKVTQWVSS